MKLRLICALLAIIAAPSAFGRAKNFTANEYSLPAGKPLSVVIMRPDIEVGQIQAGGVVEPNADWTAQARTEIGKALEANQRARSISIFNLDMRAPETPQLIADYEALHTAVADAIVTHKYYGAKLPTKKGRFDWTLGPGTQKLADLSGGTYALFVFGRDNFASDARKAMQVAGALGCLIGFCVITGGGQHVYYASLVELSTGNVVWFNILRGSKGDVRVADGARGMVDALMTSMPTRPGEGAPAQAGKAGK